MPKEEVEKKTNIEDKMPLNRWVYLPADPQLATDPVLKAEHEGDLKMSPCKNEELCPVKLPFARRIMINVYPS